MVYITLVCLIYEQKIDEQKVTISVCESSILAVYKLGRLLIIRGVHLKNGVFMPFKEIFIQSASIFVIYTVLA
ncbi:hypothetical protein COTS27_00321 [Spirochaetota bacterium]|nr:hypothetical protein COTS27_00321 [Spirochaetota bacterium]